MKIDVALQETQLVFKMLRRLTSSSDVLHCISDDNAADKYFIGLKEEFAQMKDGAYSSKSF